MSESLDANRFSRILLCMQDTKTIMMTNNTLLPINWKLSGLENLGEDFSVSAESGTIPPLTSLPFHAFFRAQKVCNYVWIAIFFHFMTLEKKIKEEEEEEVEEEEEEEGEEEANVQGVVV